jgi:hypothetical protein
MATSTLLSNPVFTINAVDVSDQTTSLSPKIKATALAATAFGDSSTKFVAGLYDNEVSAEMYWSEAASETYATLKSLIGTTTTITWKAAVGATEIRVLRNPHTGKLFGAADNDTNYKVQQDIDSSATMRWSCWMRPRYRLTSVFKRRSAYSFAGAKRRNGHVVSLNM